MSVSKQKIIQYTGPGTQSTLGINAQRVVAKRYSLKDIKGNPLEQWDDIVRRVVSHVAKAETDPQRREEFAIQMMRLMLERDFVPNTPCLVNAGKPKAQLAACFVLPVPDSLDGIMEHAKQCALIHQSGGGCISSDARVWTTFCGLETIEVLFNRATAEGRTGELKGNGWAYDVSDLDIRTASMNPATGETGLRQVTHVWKFDVPTDDQVLVKTREGVRVQTSRWHPFMVLRGTELQEARADELRSGDVVLSPEKPDNYWPWHEYRDVRGHRVDADFAWLIGFTLGDGSFGYLPSQRRLRFRLFSGTTDVLEKAREVMAQHGSELTIYKDKRGLFSLNTLGQDIIYTLLEACGLENIGPKDERIRVPEIITKSPLDCVRSFLAGLLDSDGYVARDGSPSYSTASLEMAEDLAALCSLLGYRPTVSAKQPNGKGRHVIYNVQLCILPQVARLAEDLKPYLANSLRRARLQSESLRQRRIRVDIKPWRERLQQSGLAQKRGWGLTRNGMCSEELNRWSCDTGGRCNRNDLAQIAELMQENGDPLGQLLSRVAEYGIEIESVGPASERKDFYDLSVAEWNTYAAGTHGLAMIHNTGMTYEFLRPAGTPVGEGRGMASGPVSFMQIVNTMTETVKQGGVRRGANMGILAVAHPDILRFIHAKNDQKSLTNFNISVTVTDKFLKAVESNEWFQTEFNGKPWNEPIFDPKANDGLGGEYTYKGQQPPRPGQVFAPDIWHRIIESTHRWAEPGIIFIDNVNRHNPMMNSMGPKRASNPCAEQLLHDYNACNLGSIDVAKYYDEKMDDVDWDRFATDIYWCTRFLDNVIDTCTWPLPEIDDTVRRTRPVGLGIMGFADLCLHKRITYGSREGAIFADRLSDFFRKESWKASLALGAEKGVMPEFAPNHDLYDELIYNKVDLDRSIPLTPRNYEVTTIAPTGTISLVAETSSGCEPNFSYAYVRRDTIGTRTYAHPIAAKVLGIELDNTDPESIDRAAGYIVENRDKLPDYFVDAMTLMPDDHLRVLKAFQDHIDNSISKCVVGDTLVMTANGLVPIAGLSEMRNEDQFEPLEIAVVTPQGIQQTDAFYYGGMRETRKLSLAYGYEVEGTPNHRVQTLGEDGAIRFTQLDELKVGDTVALYSGQQVFGAAEQVLPPPSQGIPKNAKPIRIPARMSVDLAYLIGCITSDGDINKNGVRLTQNGRELLEKVGKIFEQLFGITPGICQDSRNEVCYLQAASRPLRDWMLNNLEMQAGAHNKIIPDCILRASRSEITAFLRGLFLDAYMTANGRMFGIGLASRKLLAQLQVVLLNFGVASRISQTGPAAWTLTIAGEALQRFSSFAEFDQAQKVERMPAHDEGRIQRGMNYSTMLPVAVTEALREAQLQANLSLRASYGGGNKDYQRARVNLLQGHRLDRATARHVYDYFNGSSHPFLKNFFDADRDGLLYVTVEGIERGFAEVFDLSVPGARSFIANGLGNHNTVNAPSSYSLEDTDRVHRLAWKMGVKAVSYYRDGSRDDQVLTAVTGEQKTAPKSEAKVISEALLNPIQTTLPRIERPRELNGATWQIPFDHQNLYVTINHDGGRVLEVFATGAGLSVSVGLLASKMLRGGFEPEQVATSLSKVIGNHSIWFNERMCTSPEQVVAECIMLTKRRLMNQPDSARTAAKQTMVQQQAGQTSFNIAGMIPTPVSVDSKKVITVCPECSSNQIEYAGGCYTCRDCGFSKCV